MREQMVLQLMVNIGRYYDARSELATTIDNLAIYQQVPVEMIGRMLEALEQDGLVRRSSDEPPCYLPARSINRISLNEIIRSSRDAESADHVDVFICDASVSELLTRVDERYTFVLGDQTLADFLEKENA
jgi:DNA-binding IscR family transcriptional regulator